MKPICVRCERFFKPKQNGFYFIEGMPRENGAKPGTVEPEKWQPYKLWVGDLWECPGCQTTLISGVGRGPIAEQYQADFADKAKRLGAELQVNDC